MSPRRSSRARLTGPGAQPTNGSNANGRLERSTRSHNKRDTSSAQRSMSREESVNGFADSLATRRSKRGADPDNQELGKTHLDDDEEEEVEAEEVTRCICGFAEYPGPPVTARDGGTRTAKAPVRDESGAQAPAPVEGVPEDAGNFFIQCDKCQVWQHGGCVGLMDEAMSPDEYFCELCKPLLHKTIKGPNGSKSTRYLPVLEASSSRASSTSSNETARKKDAKAQAAKDANTRRRATMNSREAAYDEEEMMRRAIEESKIISGTLGKRSRDESEEKPSTSKRVRTSSASPEARASPGPSEIGSDEDDDSKNMNGGSSRKIRGAVARVQREKDSREKQKEVEKQKKEDAATRRNARSERRRGEDTPPPTPSLSPSKHEAKAAAAPVPKAAPPDTPSSHRPASANTQRKTGRPARKGRIRSQYTNGEESPLRDVSSGGQGSPQGGNVITNGESGRPSRAKHVNPTRTSMNEMKRRVAGIIEFVSRLQTEHPSSPSQNGNTPNGASHEGSSTANASPSSKNGEQDQEALLRKYRQMGSIDMMEELMRGALTWQTSYGKYGEK